MSMSRIFAALLIAFAAPALAQNAPIDLHNPAPAKPAKDSKEAKDAKDAKPAAPKQAISAQEAVKRANAWFAKAQNLTADFVQIGPDGHRGEGKLYLSRPGRMRFQFAPPDRLEIVADGRSVAVRDQKMDTQDLYLIEQTPLKFLLKEQVDLAHDTQVLGVETSDSSVTIKIDDKATLGGEAKIALAFDPTTFALKQWTVDDAQGFETVVTLFNIDLTSVPDEALFKIDEQRMIGQKK